MSANSFQRLNSIVDSGVLANLSAVALRVLFVYMRHADYKTGKAWQSNKTTASKIGLKNVNRLRRAIRELETAGILQTTDAGGGRNNPATRMILMMERGTDSVPLCDDDTGTDSVPLSPKERGTLSDLKGDAFEPKGGHFRAQRGTPVCPPNSINTLRNTTTNTMAADGGAGGGECVSDEEKDKCLAQLKDIGIHNPQRFKIASIPGMRDFVIAGVWNEVEDESCDNPLGLFVSRIMADPQGLIAEHTESHARETDRDEERAEQENSRIRFMEELKSVDALFSKLYEKDNEHIDATIAEMKQSVHDVGGFTETLLEYELQSRCGDVPHIPGNCLAAILTKPALRAIVAAAWNDQTYHQDEWFNKHLKTPHPNQQQLQSA